MNANEVIANRALEILGYSKGGYTHLHPNDDVNFSQSTNDAYPTAIKLAVYFSLQDTLGALDEMKAALEAKAQEFAQVLKMGRTENQDAVPMTLGQKFGVFSQMAGNIKRSAVQLSKICNDLRWMSSGPRCGLYEIRLPAMQPGSSLMPGKVNPVIPEMVNQVCFTIIGYDVTVAMASEASELELNMAEPIIAYCLLHELMILKNAAIVLTSRASVENPASAGDDFSSTVP